jgi:hypothetical protein
VFWPRDFLAWERPTGEHAKLSVVWSCLLFCSSCVVTFVLRPRIVFLLACFCFFLFKFWVAGSPTRNLLCCVVFDNVGSLHFVFLRCFSNSTFLCCGGLPRADYLIFIIIIIIIVVFWLFFAVLCCGAPNRSLLVSVFWLFW